MSLVYWAAGGRVRAGPRPSSVSGAPARLEVDRTDIEHGGR